MKKTYSYKDVFDDLIHLRKRNYGVFLKILFDQYIQWPMKKIYFEIMFFILVRMFDRFDLYIKLDKIKLIRRCKIE